MIDTFLRVQYNRQHIEDMLRQAEVDRQARQAYRPRSMRYHLGRLLIAAGQTLIGQPAYSAYDEALVIAERSW